MQRKQTATFWQEGDSIFSVIWEKISPNQWTKVCGSEKLVRKCKDKDEAAEILAKARGAQVAI